MVLYIYMKDYRVSHMEERIVRQYEDVVYKPGSYDDYLWSHERKILELEVIRLRTKCLSLSYLDFGCGTGRIISYMEQFADLSLGVDISEPMIEVARSKVKKSGFIVADITREDVLAGKTFDLITAFRIFLNAGPELRSSMLAALVQKLQNEDSLLIFNIHGNIMSHRIFTKLLFLLRGRNLNTMSVGEVKRFASEHGLEVVRWYGFGVIPKVFYRIFGGKLMFMLDSLLARVPLMKFISYDLIFVCKKK